jgi:hypothetical protein
VTSYRWQFDGHDENEALLDYLEMFLLALNTSNIQSNFKILSPLVTPRKTNLNITSRA